MRLYTIWVLGDGLAHQLNYFSSDKKLNKLFMYLSFYTLGYS
jgi:hypothetical protein